MIIPDSVTDRRADFKVLLRLFRLKIPCPTINPILIEEDDEEAVKTEERNEMLVMSMSMMMMMMISMMMNDKNYI